jgi:DNA-binding NtrC family response regulator
VEIAGDARRGTTVRLFLPHAHAPRRKQSPSLDALEGASVLLADDDEDLLRVSGTMLRKSGLHVYAAHGGRAAINVYRRHGPKVDVSIVDAIMPGPSGSEVITAIARMNPEARIVVTSGFAREYARTLVPPGAWTFLQKPFDHEQLLATLRRTLSQPLAPR